MRLRKLLTAEKLYLSPDATASMMAERLGSRPRNISSAVLSATGGNYSQYINNLRIKEACRRLTADRYKNLTVEDVGLSCGYQSRQAFYHAFKKQMGCTPLQWRENPGLELLEPGSLDD